MQDTAVVRDLRTGDEERWTDEELRAAVLAEVAGTGNGGDLLEAQHSGLSWVGEAQLAVGSVRLEVASMTDGEPGVSIRPEVGGSPVRVLGFDRSTNMFIMHGDIRGGSTSPLTVLADDFTSRQVGVVTAAAFDSSYDNLAVVNGTRLWIDGQELELEVAVASFDW